jgi:hypothetical protein
MAQVSLLIIYQQTMKATAFWLQHMQQVAGWLRQILQADQKSIWKTAVALEVDPPIGFCIDILIAFKRSKT